MLAVSSPDEFRVYMVLHLPTTFHPNGTHSANLWSHINFFSRRQPKSPKSTSGFGFNNGTCLGMLKCTSTPIFYEISQSTSELLLHLVSENGRLLYWNTIVMAILTFSSLSDGILYFVSAYKFHIHWSTHHQSYDIISIFQDDGQRVGNLLPAFSEK